MRFAKYQGTGNDFVMLADLDDRVDLSAELVQRLCDRRFGIGADGVIRVAPGRDGGELFMDYVNSDGSIGEMCGNGIRCLAIFARSEGLTESDEIKVDTRAGVKVVRVLEDERVQVDMGAPVFEPDRIPVRWQGKDALAVPLLLPPKESRGHPTKEPSLQRRGQEIEVACLSMGNPHAVLFVDDPASAPVRTLGPLVENHEMFPRKANVEFVRVGSEQRIHMRVWERGAGETMACGTGACAAAVAARLLRGTSPKVTVVLPGGELEIEWDGSLERDAPVVMTGPAQESFRGEVDLDAYRGGAA